MRFRWIRFPGALAVIGLSAFCEGIPSSLADEPSPWMAGKQVVPTPQHGLFSELLQSPGSSAGTDDSETVPPEIEAILDRRKARQQACEHEKWPRWCRYCAQTEAALAVAPLSLRPFSTELGLLAVGRPYQYLPPQYGWATAVPAFPPRTMPGSPAVPAGPWRMPHYENDFRYLDNPENRVVDPFDMLKRIPAPVDAIVSDFGGEFRWQGRVEQSRRLLGEQNNHNLFRERLYLDTWYWGRFRTFVEVFWADSTRQAVPPVFVDLNHGDLLNAFGEFRFFEQDGRTFSGRFGSRQQMLFGNQRLVSPLDWANSPRTFQNVAHGLWRSPDWNLDVFWNRPNVIYPSEFDRANQAQQFFGSYLVYKGIENQLYDFYYFGFLQENRPGAVFNGEPGNLAIHTLGTRWQGERNGWRWEGEGSYQFGFHQGLPRNAGAVSAGFGRRFTRLPFDPELMFYLDYASGNRRPGAGSFATFNQLFPLGHKFFGYMDAVGRQNIISPNAFVRFNFGTRAHLVFWYHNFQLASAQAPLFNAAGTPIRFDPTGAAGRYVGNELDILLTTYLNPHADFQFGVSNFFSGSFIRRTAPTPAAADNGFFFYTQFTFRF